MAHRTLFRGGQPCRWADASGASVVEFAILAPVFLTLVFGVVAFGAALGFAHSLQTVASEGARAAVAGLDPDERASLARTSIRNSLAANALLNPRAVTVDVGPDAADPDLFTVTLRYDLSGSVVGLVPRVLPVPTGLVRTASIRRGGL